MKIAASALIGIASLALQVPGGAQTSRHFFPTRPAHAVLHGENGLLTSFGIGNDTAGLTIRRADGHTDAFYLAFPHTFNGKRASCKVIAEPSVAPGYSECKERLPASIVVGKTRVHVTYWSTTFNGSPVKVTDAISIDP